MVVELARDDLVGDLNDQFALFLIQKFQLDIGHGCGLFQDAERLDELSMHSVPPGPGLEILQRTLGLGAPVAIGGDCDFAHGVLFDASFSHLRYSFLLLPLEMRFKVQGSKFNADSFAPFQVFAF